MGSLKTPDLVSVIALLLPAGYNGNNFRRADNFFSSNMYQTSIKDDNMGGFSGNTYLELVTSQWKFPVFAVTGMWLFGRSSFNAWEPQERSERCVVFCSGARAVVLFFFQLKMGKL